MKAFHKMDSHSFHFSENILLLVHKIFEILLRGNFKHQIFFED